MQWEEELISKFNLETVTTNHAAFRAVPGAVWRNSAGIVASLHTLKQLAHLAIAREIKWGSMEPDGNRATDRALAPSRPAATRAHLQLRPGGNASGTFVADPAREIEPVRTRRGRNRIDSGRPVRQR